MSARFSEINNPDILEFVILNSPGHIYWKNVEGKYLGCNNKQAEFLNLKEGVDIIGLTDYDLPWKKTADAIRELDKKVIKTRKSYEVEECVEVDGKISWFLSNKVPLIDKKGAVVGVFGVSVDVSERKIAENNLIKLNSELKIANKKNCKILNSVGRELSEPLQNIISLSEIDNLNQDFNISNVLKVSSRKIFSVLDSIRDYTQNIESDLVNINNLELLSCSDIEKLLNFSSLLNKHSIESLFIFNNLNKFSIKTNPIILKAVVNGIIDIVIKNGVKEIVGDFYLETSENNEGVLLLNISFRYNRCETFDGYDLAVENFELSSCDQYLNTIGGKINFNKKNDNDILSFNVELPVCFEKEDGYFCDIPSSLKINILNNNKYLTKFLPKLFPDKDVKIIDIDSLYDELDNFSILLLDIKSSHSISSKFFKEKRPLFLVYGEGGIQELYSPNQFSQKIESNYTQYDLIKNIKNIWYSWPLKIKMLSPIVLIVEDNKINSKVISLVLQDLGCETLLAESAFAAKSILKKNIDFSLILTDIMLPDERGYHLIKDIKNNISPCVPVIAMTASASEEDMDSCILAGADDVLSKPVLKKSLDDALRAYI